MPNIELTDREVELITMAVDNSAHELETAEVTDGDDEARLLYNKVFLEYKELQKKFPPYLYSMDENGEIVQHVADPDQPDDKEGQ